MGTATGNYFKDGRLAIAYGDPIPEGEDLDGYTYEPVAKPGGEIGGDPLPESAGQVVITGARVQAGDALDVDDVASTEQLKSGVSTEAQILADGGAQQSLTTSGAAVVEEILGASPDTPTSAADGQAVDPAGVIPGEGNGRDDATVDELKAEARDRGLSGYSSLNRAELVKLLESDDDAKAGGKQLDAAPEDKAMAGPDETKAGE